MRPIPAKLTGDPVASFDHGLNLSVGTEVYSFQARHRRVDVHPSVWNVIARGHDEVEVTLPDFPVWVYRFNKQPMGCGATFDHAVYKARSLCSTLDGTHLKPLDPQSIEHFARMGAHLLAWEYAQKKVLPASFDPEADGLDGRLREFKDTLRKAIFSAHVGSLEDVRRMTVAFREAIERFDAPRPAEAASCEP